MTTNEVVSQVVQDVQKLETDVKDATIARLEAELAALKGIENKVKAEVFSIEAFLISKVKAFLNLSAVKGTISFVKTHFRGILHTLAYASIVALLLHPEYRTITTIVTAVASAPKKPGTAVKACPVTVKHVVGK